MTSNFNIVFTEDPHGYMVDGHSIVSATQILDDAGLIDFEGIPDHLLEFAAQRGDAVHAATRFIDEENIDWLSIDERIKPYLKAYELFKEESGFEPIMMEERVYHPFAGYCGTLDRIGVMNNLVTLADLKSGAMPFSIGLQTAAYTMAAELTFDGIGIQQRLGIQLKPNGKYRPFYCTNTDDFDDFQTLTKSYYIKKLGKGRKT